MVYPLASSDRVQASSVTRHSTILSNADTRKQNGQDVFIAKVELGTINVSQGLAVGSILASWQQDSILVNDAIIY